VPSACEPNRRLAQTPAVQADSCIEGVAAIAISMIEITRD